jgi:hypothetical protein
MTRKSMQVTHFSRDNIQYKNGYHGIYFPLDPHDGKVASCFVEVNNAKKALDHSVVTKGLKQGYINGGTLKSTTIRIVSEKEVYEAFFPTCTWNTPQSTLQALSKASPIRRYSIS